MAEPSVQMLADDIREQNPGADYDKYTDASLVEAHRLKFFPTVPKDQFYSALAEEYQTPLQQIKGAITKVLAPVRHETPPPSDLSAFAAEINPGADRPTPGEALRGVAENVAGGPVGSAAKFVGKSIKDLAVETAKTVPSAARLLSHNPVAGIIQPGEYKQYTESPQSREDMARVLPWIMGGGITAEAEHAAAPLLAKIASPLLKRMAQGALGAEAFTAAAEPTAAAVQGRPVSAGPFVAAPILGVAGGVFGSIVHDLIKGPATHTLEAEPPSTPSEPPPPGAVVSLPTGDKAVVTHVADDGVATLHLDDGKAVEAPAAAIVPKKPAKTSVSRPSEAPPVPVVAETAVEPSGPLGGRPPTISPVEEGDVPTVGLGGSPAVKATETPPVVATPPPPLPRELAGAKPRYSYGTKSFIPSFESDVDKAAYITAQTARSKSDAAYLKFAMDATGMTEPEVRAHGASVKATIKGMAKDAEEGSTLTVPDQLPKSVAPEGAAKPRYIDLKNDLMQKATAYDIAAANPKATSAQLAAADEAYNTAADLMKQHYPQAKLPTGHSTLHSWLIPPVWKALPEGWQGSLRGLFGDQSVAEKMPSGFGHVGLRFARLGEPGIEMGELLHRARSGGGALEGHFTKLWHEARGDQLSPESNIRVGLAKEFEGEYAQGLTPHEQGVLGVLQESDATLGKMGLDTGALARTREHYLSHRPLHIDQAFDRAGNLTDDGRQAVAYDVAASEARGVPVTAEQSAHQFRSLRDIQHLSDDEVIPAVQNRTVNLAYPERMIREGKLPTTKKGVVQLSDETKALVKAGTITPDTGQLLDAVNLIRHKGARWADSNPLESWQSAEENAVAFHQRKLDIPWIVRISKGMPKTFHENATEIMQAAHFGPHGEELAKLARQVKGRTPLQVKKDITELLKASLTPRDVPFGHSKWGSKLQEFTSLISLGKDTAMKKLVAGINVLVTSDHESYAHGVKMSMTKKGRARARELNMLQQGTPEIIGGAEANFSGVSNFTHRHLTFLSRAVDRDRVVAVNAGDVWIPKLVRWFTEGGSKAQFAADELRKYTIDTRALKVTGKLSTDEVNRAVRRYAELTEHMLSAQDLPPWMMNSPQGRLSSQFMHWPYAQTRLVLRETLGQLQKGHTARGLGNIAKIGGEAIPLGTAASMGIDWMKGKKDPHLMAKALDRFVHGTATERDKQIILAYLVKGYDLTAGGMMKFITPSIMAALGMRSTSGKMTSLDEARDALTPGAASLGLIGDVAPTVAQIAARKLQGKRVPSGDVKFLASRPAFTRVDVPMTRRLADLLPWQVPRKVPFLGGAGNKGVKKAMGPNP